MRRLVYIFVFITLLGFVLSGCRQSAVERRLVEIDTLIARGDYDSALAQLRAIDTTTLSRDELAYHGLLMVHAAYKAYADSICFDTTWITRARTAYADGGPYDRHIRTLLYSGCIAEDLGDPLTAMRWYKRTELEARPEDGLKGHALMSMGVLHQINGNTQNAIKCYLKSMPNLSKTDSVKWLYVTEQLAQQYILVDNDSADLYIDMLMRHAIDAGDSATLYIALLDKTRKAFYDEQYTASKDLATDVIRKFENSTPFICWYFASYSFSQLGNRDSASFYLHSAPPIDNEFDSIYYYKALSLVKELGKDWEQAHSSELSSERLVDKQIDSKLAALLISMEFDVEQEFNNASARLRLKTVLSIVLVLIAFVAIVLWMRFRKMRQQERDSRKQIEWLKENLEQLKSSSQDKTDAEAQTPSGQNIESSDLEFVKNLYIKLRSTFASCIGPMGGIASEFYEQKKASRFMGEFMQAFNSCWEENAFWEELEAHINSTRNNALKRFDEKHPNLTRNERRLFLLTIFHFDPMAISVCMKYSNADVVYTMRNKLKKKLGTNLSVENYFRTFESPATD